jgi:polysaccharide pyruvyl transferase WcaK-like protein
LYAQCSRRWIFRIDGDEVPSVALVERLGELPEDPRVTHVFVGRQWLWPVPDTFLADDPWGSDVSLRLLRDDVALMLFLPLVHDVPSIPGQGLFWEEPIYHLDLLLNSMRDREEKAARYEALRPGLRTQSGYALNSSYYLPEAAFDPPRPVPVPSVDIARLMSALDAAEQPPTRSEEHVAVVPARVLLGMVPEPLAEQDYRAKIEFCANRAVFAVERPRMITVRITNLGTEPWRARDDGLGVMVGARWCDLSGSVLEADVARSLLPCDVAPGTTIVVPIDVPPPASPGEYVLEADLVNEQVRWFDCPCSMAVRVRRTPKIVVCTGRLPFRHFGHDAIVRGALVALARHCPDVEPVLLDSSPGVQRPDFAAEMRPDAFAALAIERRSTRSAVALRLAALLRDARRATQGRELSHERNRELIETVNGGDLVLLLSAGALASRYWHGLWTHAAVALVGRRLGKPVVLAGVGVGPYRGFWDRLVASAMFRSASTVMTRDGGASRRELLRFGVRRHLVAGEDLARFMVRGPEAETLRVLAGQGLDVDAAYAVVSMRGTSGGDPLVPIASELLEELTDLGLTLIYLPHVEGAEEGNDVEEGLRLARSNPLLKVLDPMPTDAVIVDIIARAAVAVGSRFHLSVIAAGAGVGALALVDDRGDDYDRRRVDGLRRTTDTPIEVVGLADGASEARQVLAGLVRRQSPRRPTPDLADHPVVELVRRFVETEVSV